MHSELATSNSQLATSSTTDQEVLVRVEGVSKKFCRSLKKSLWYGVCDIGAELNPFRRRVAEVAGSGSLVTGNGSKQDSSELATSDSPLVTPHGLRPDEFYAVRDVSFELRRGECLGLIGHNGAGKTTLLKMLNGLIKPDAGTITMRGRVGALIALGAGFNPILTGRENIYINGSVLGLSKKEIDAKIDEIIAFAEIGEFIDSPVQNYSSGMSVRLGFSIASALSPDVLIVDEVLAVGDTNFKIKCYNRIKELLAHTAVILVSHNMFDIARACTGIIVLKNGRAHYSGEIEKGIHIYNLMNESGEQRSRDQPLEINLHKGVSGISDVELQLRTEGISTSLDFSFRIDANTDLGEIRARFVFFDQTQCAVAEWDSNHHGASRTITKGVHTLVYHVDHLRLKSDHYRVVFNMTDPKMHGYFCSISDGLTIAIENSATVGAAYKV